jgi:phenylpropionate dioxygenase-like ring-hydroxylating dioxygenase large terminal subunit
MIPDSWYPVLESNALGRRPVRLRRLGRDLVAWRDGRGRAALVPRHCPHRGAGLENGRVIDGELECPWHGFRFDHAGACTAIPCNVPGTRIPAGLELARVPVQEAHGLLWAWHGAERSEYPAVPWFDDLGARCFGTSYDLPFHYTRMMESNLDMHHFPFAHATLLGLPFGRLFGTVVDPVETGGEGERIWMDGQLRRAERESGERFRLELFMPCLVRICFRGFDLIAASTPIDEKSTWVMARYYHPRSKLLCWFMIQSEMRAVQKQDWRVFETLEPGTIDDVDFRLVRADEAIALYRRLRRKRLDAHARTDAA